MMIVSKKSYQKLSKYIQFYFKKRFELDKEKGFFRTFRTLRRTFAHAVTTQTRVNTIAQLEQGGLIPSYLVQKDKEITSLRKASYEIRTKHVELAGHYNLFLITSLYYNSRDSRLRRRFPRPPGVPSSAAVKRLKNRKIGAPSAAVTKIVWGAYGLPNGLSLPHTDRRIGPPSTVLVYRFI